MTRQLALAVFLLLLASLLCGCADTVQTYSDQPYEQTEELLGTYISVKIYGTDSELAKSAADAAFSRAKELETILSPSIADSEICKVNAQAFSEETKISDSMLDVLEKALYYSDLTDGALDCTIGDLIDLWGIGTEYAHVPDNTEIQNILRQNSYTMVVLDTDIPTVRFTQPEVTLHFGAIAKGYIADEMKSVLENYGIESGCLSLGGNVLTIGAKPSGKPWTVGITDPLSPENITATLQVTDLSVVTSGNYERYFYEDGVRYHHILDPDTGYPAENGLISATIIGSSSVDCDALSTAVYVLGSEKGMALIESLEDVEAVLITDDGTVLTSSGIEKYQFQQVTQ